MKLWRVRRVGYGLCRWIIGLLRTLCGSGCLSRTRLQKTREQAGERSRGIDANDFEDAEYRKRLDAMDRSAAIVGMASNRDDRHGDPGGRRGLSGGSWNGYRWGDSGDVDAIGRGASVDGWTRQDCDLSHGRHSREDGALPGEDYFRQEGVSVAGSCANTTSRQSGICGKGIGVMMHTV